MKTSCSKTEMFNDVKNLLRLLHISELILFTYDQIYVNVCMNEVTICRSAHRSFDSHQTMFFRSLKHSLWVEYFGMFRSIMVRFDPTNVFTPPKAPLLQAVSSQIETLWASTPQKHEWTVRCDRLNFQIHDLVPIPEVAAWRAARSTSKVLFKWRLDENDIELRSEWFEIKIWLQICLEKHWWCCCFNDEFVFKLNKLSQLRVFLESVLKSDITNEVLRSLASIDKVLAVVIVGIWWLSSLKCCEWAISLYFWLKYKICLPSKTTRSLSIANFLSVIFSHCHFQSLLPTILGLRSTRHPEHCLSQRHATLQTGK